MTDPEDGYQSNFIAKGKKEISCARNTELIHASSLCDCMIRNPSGRRPSSCTCRRVKLKRCDSQIAKTISQKSHTLKVGCRC